MAIPLRDDAPTRQVPWMTLTLLVVNVLIFLFLQPAALQGGGSSDDDSGRDVTATSEVDLFALQWGVVPCEIQEGKSLSEGITCSGESPGIRPEESKLVFLALLSHMFIHGSILHLAGNMLFLWVFGGAVEDRLGPIPYLLLYVATGVLAVLAHVAIYWNDAVPVLGASGAIAGIMGAYLVFRPRGRLLSVVLWTVVYVPAWVLLGLFFVTQFLTPDSDGVAWEAHAAGMLAGFLFALVLARFFKDPFAPPPPPPLPVGAATWVLPATPPSEVPN